MTAAKERAPNADVFVGLMSGTSTDGISAAAVRFAEGDGPAGRLSAELLGFAQPAYSPAQRDRLLTATRFGTPQEYCRLNADVGAWLADAAAALLDASGVARERVRAVASHGHTVWHEAGHSTWQTGDAAVIAERLGVDVVSDFRVRDVAAGGQGAPLVAAADAMLFAAPDRWRALQNLGGIGNVTAVPPNGVSNGLPHGAAAGGVRAFDTGPGVAVVDGVVRRFRPDLPYDVDGAMARAGRPVRAAVDELLDDEYFRRPPPKSTGRELFGADYVERLVSRCREREPGATDEDVVATAVSLTARSVADAYGRFLDAPVGDALLSGGGARNPALVAAIREALGAGGRHAGVAVRLFDDVFFDGEAKEAVAFALLGYLHVRGVPGNVPGATGARGPRVLGKLAPA